MNIQQLTEEQFFELAVNAERLCSFNSTSMAFFKSTDGLLIQNVSGDYFLIQE